MAYRSTSGKNRRGRSGQGVGEGNLGENGERGFRGQTDKIGQEATTVDKNRFFLFRAFFSKAWLSASFDGSQFPGYLLF